MFIRANRSADPPEPLIPFAAAQIHFSTRNNADRRIALEIELAPFRRGTSPIS
jgi:hypothetical protein